MSRKLNKKNRLVQHIRYLFGGLKNDIRINRIKIQEIHATALLQSLNAKGNYDPLSVFSMMPSTITHILNDILVNDRKSIIEFGSGNSTVYLARLIHHHKLSIQFYSVDQDPNWQKKIQMVLKNEGIPEVVKFVYAPLNDCEYQFKTQKEWYDTETLKNIIGNTLFDLIIVDGPTAAVIECARYPAIPFLANNMCQSKSIFLDDSNRGGEKQIVQEWQKLLNAEFKNTNRHSYLVQGTDMITLPLFFKEV